MCGRNRPPRGRTCRRLGAAGDDGAGVRGLKRVLVPAFAQCEAESENKCLDDLPLRTSDYISRALCRRHKGPRERRVLENVGPEYVRKSSIPRRTPPQATYAGVYTPMKVRSPYNTHIGAISGALPTLLGFSAALGTGLAASPWAAPAAWLFTMQARARGRWGAQLLGRVAGRSCQRRGGRTHGGLVGCAWGSAPCSLRRGSGRPSMASQRSGTPDPLGVREQLPPAGLMRAPDREAPNLPSPPPLRVSADAPRVEEDWFYHRGRYCFVRPCTRIVGSTDGVAS